MTQFRKAPFISELNRPFLTGQPQHINVSQRDISKVYHSIQQRQYSNISEVCADMRRIFKTYVSYHSHTLVERKDCMTGMAKVIHLREYFNWLWAEYMIPSDIKDYPIHMAHQSAHETRSKDRKERNHLLGHIELKDKFLRHAADKIRKFAALRGCVDGLDKDPIENNNEQYKVVIDFVFQDLRRIARRLLRTEVVTENGYTTYTVKDLYTDLQQCYSDLSMLGSEYSSLRLKFENRLDRLLSQILIPLHEVMCRGNSQSVVWGTTESIVLARENSTSPYWPSLVLGFLSGADSREEWHDIHTKMNEARLTEELYFELLAKQMKAEYSMKGGRDDFFLVEMLGTHKLMWVEQANVVLDEFDPEEDVAYMDRMNLTSGDRALRSKAHEEGISALNDYHEMHDDPCGKCTLDDEEDDHHSNESDERRGISNAPKIRKGSQLNFGHINKITPEARNELVGRLVPITINEKRNLPKKRKIQF